MDTPPAPPEPARAERPKWKHVVIMVLGGIVLAVGGCGMFLATLNINSSETSPLSVVGAIAFAAGLILFAIGGITGLVYLAMAVFRSSKTR